MLAALITLVAWSSLPLLVARLARPRPAGRRHVA